jgi:hypothetical protein
MVHLPSKQKVLSSNPIPPKRGRKKRKHITYPQWCDHLPLVSPEEGFHVNLGGTSLLHSTLTRGQGPPPKPVTEVEGYKDISKCSYCLHMASSEGNHDVSGKPSSHQYHSQGLKN